jgi:hypothetical protein
MEQREYVLDLIVGEAFYNMLGERLPDKQVIPTASREKRRIAAQSLCEAREKLRAAVKNRLCELEDDADEVDATSVKSKSTLAYFKRLEVTGCLAEGDRLCAIEADLGALRYLN